MPRLEALDRALHTTVAMASSKRIVSIGTRLVATTTSLLTIVALLVYVGLSRYERASLLEAKETAAKMVVSLFAMTSQAPVVFEDRSGVEEGIAGLASNPEVTFAAVYPVSKDDPSKLDSAVGILQRGDAPTADDLLTVPSPARVRRAGDYLVVVARIPDPRGGKPVGAACAIFSLARENAAIDQVERAILRDSLGVAFLVAAVLVVFARRSIIRPLSRLASAAKQLERGEKVDIDVASDDEIGVLASGFRAMTNAIAQREEKINARNADMRLVLDNLEQGLITLRRDGSISEERSATVDRWFGAPTPGAPIWQYLASTDADIGDALRVAWEALAEEVMPLEVCLEQMPRRMRKGERTYELSYRPVLEGEAWSKLVLVVSDVTARLEAERAEESQREILAVFERILRDPQGFASFYEECSKLVATVKDATASLVVIQRALHTLKGNCSLFGIASVARVGHQIESRIKESPSHPSREEDTALSEAWGAIARTCERLSGSGGTNVTIHESDFQELLSAIHDGKDPRTLATMVTSLRSEPVSLSLERYADRARALATNLGKADLQVVIDPSPLRLPPQRFRPFWSAFTHVVRNAVDHGIETEDERLAAGKPARATLRLTGYATSEGVHLVAQDDGRGVDWVAVAAKARATNLPAATHADLVDALCADAFTTRAMATETSGRGVGLSAVREVVRSMGGRIEVESARGQGSLFRFVFPRSCLEEVALGRDGRRPAVNGGPETVRHKREGMRRDHG
jgi:two-component system chemotaxis sensor kinase CheA